MIYSITIGLFVLVCILLVGIILIQTSKSGGLGAGIAGNAGLNDAFGGQGADKLLRRITIMLAVIFMLLALYLSSSGSSSSSSKEIEGIGTTQEEQN